jgi:hypothetical protein
MACKWQMGHRRGISRKVQLRRLGLPCELGPNEQQARAWTYDCLVLAASFLGLGDQQQSHSYHGHPEPCHDGNRKVRWEDLAMGKSQSDLMKTFCSAYFLQGRRQRNVR